MSLSNTTENAVLKCLLQGTDPSYRAGATQYIMLSTADPGEAGSRFCDVLDHHEHASG